MSDAPADDLVTACAMALLRGHDEPESGDCPQRGVVRWLGIRWYGVPMPVRWWLAALHERDDWIDKLPACGCVVALKDWWAGVRGVEQSQGTSCCG